MYCVCYIQRIVFVDVTIDSSRLLLSNSETKKPDICDYADLLFKFVHFIRNIRREEKKLPIQHAWGRLTILKATSIF